MPQARKLFWANRDPEHTHKLRGLVHFRLKIVAGDHDTSIRPEEGEQTVEICGKKVHHLYTGSGQNDIALLELCDQIVFTHSVQPIGLAPENLDVFELNQENATVAGWGVTSEGGRQSKILMAVNVPIVGKEFEQGAVHKRRRNFLGHF